MLRLYLVIRGRRLAFPLRLLYNKGYKPAKYHQEQSEEVDNIRLRGSATVTSKKLIIIMKH